MMLIHRQEVHKDLAPEGKAPLPGLEQSFPAAQLKSIHSNRIFSYHLNPFDIICRLQSWSLWGSFRLWPRLLQFQATHAWTTWTRGRVETRRH